MIGARVFCIVLFFWMWKETKKIDKRDVENPELSHDQRDAGVAHALFIAGCAGAFRFRGGRGLLSPLIGRKHTDTWRL